MDALAIIATTYIEGRTEPSGHIHARAIVAALHAAGYHIIHRDENHGPTLERAAEAVGNHNKTGREWVPGSLWDSITQEAVGRIRAMEVKHG